MANITFISKNELKEYQFLLDIIAKYFNLFIKSIKKLNFLKTKFFLISFILKINNSLSHSIFCINIIGKMLIEIVFQ